MALGSWCWFDLNTTDIEAAKAFYKAVIGWDILGVEAPDGGYAMWANGDAGVGGLMLLPEQAKAMGAPPSWVGYVEVADADTMAARVQALGGTLYAPVTVIDGGRGRFFVFADPQGAVAACYESPQGPSADPPLAPGFWSWSELGTSDGGAALAFYTELFGWKAGTAMDMGPGGIYQMYGKTVEGRGLGGIFTKGPGMGPPAWLHYFRVADLDIACAAVTAGGGEIVNGPMQVPSGEHIVQARDPQGAFFALVA